MRCVLEDSLESNLHHRAGRTTRRHRPRRLHPPLAHACRERHHGPLQKSAFPLRGRAGGEGKCTRDDGDHMCARQRLHAPRLRYGARAVCAENARQSRLANTASHSDCDGDRTMNAWTPAHPYPALDATHVLGERQIRTHTACHGQWAYVCEQRPPEPQPARRAASFVMCVGE